MKALTSYKLGPIQMKNRLVMPPMCMYSAKDDGLANDFHFTHYETRAIGGSGLIIVEATAVRPNGRISDKDLGIWSDDHIEGLKEIASRIKKHGACPGIQIAHAGRKCTVEKEKPVAPSAIAYSDDFREPMALSLEAIEGVIQGFFDGAMRAVEAGFEFIEVHGAHGYLIHEFLSPYTNQRDDAYGGNLLKRCRLLKEIITRIKIHLPKEVVLGLRISATDYVEGGIDCNEMVQIINEVKEGLEIIHVSSGGLISVDMNVYPGYQVQFAEQIKKECQMDTIAVGKITTIEMIEEALNNQRCDMVALGRLLLRNPYFPLQQYGRLGMNERIPAAYNRAF